VKAAAAKVTAGTTSLVAVAMRGQLKSSKRGQGRKNRKPCQQREQGLRRAEDETVGPGGGRVPDRCQTLRAKISDTLGPRTVRLAAVKNWGSQHLRSEICDAC
jgi:hypothetical protein